MSEKFSSETRNPNKQTITNWFICKTGVKQGDTLLSALLSFFINDLVQDINNLNLGVKLINRKLSMLLHVYMQMTLLYQAKSPEDLQCILDTLHLWCKRCREQFQLYPFSENNVQIN